jgi:hypothetical protein
MEAAAAKPVLRVAAICGSLRKASFNRGLLRAGTYARTTLLPPPPPAALRAVVPATHHILSLGSAAAEVCEDSIPGLRVDHLDISDLPLINTDLETGGGGFPPAVEAFRAKVCQADCFLFAAPEYNYSIASTSQISPPPLRVLPTRSDRGSDPGSGRILKFLSRGKNCNSIDHVPSTSLQLGKYYTASIE